MIYFDFDETLASQDLYGNEAGLTQLRPGVKEFLEELRNATKSPLYLLSAGINSYVRHNNTLHKLGFIDENIIGRESLYRGAFSEDMREIEIPIKKDVCPNGVLIENQPVDYVYTKIKMEYLGIKEDRVIIVPHFYYHPIGKDTYFLDNKSELVNKITDRLKINSAS